MRPAEAGAPPGPGEPGGAAYGKGGGNQVTAKQKTTVRVKRRNSNRVVRETKKSVHAVQNDRRDMHLR